MLFDRSWFRRHQRLLLLFANTMVGRWFFRIHGNRSSVGKRKIIRIEPNAITWRVGSRTFATEFRTNEKFARRLYYGLLPVWYVFHAWDTLIANPVAPQLNLGFDTTPDLFPAAGANSPMDGYVYRNGVNETLNGIRTGSGTGNDGATDTLFVIRLQASATTDQYQLLVRELFNFDTSSITAAYTVDSATVSIYADGSRNTGLGTSALHVAGATPAATNAIANGDYLQCQTTSFGSVAGAAWQASQYNNIALNASGLANISKTGVSKFSAQLDWDINNSFTGVWASGAQTDFQARSADQGATTNDPKLVVVYSLPVSNLGDNQFYFM